MINALGCYEITLVEGGRFRWDDSSSTMSSKEALLEVQMVNILKLGCVCYLEERRAIPFGSVPNFLSSLDVTVWACMM